MAKVTFVKKARKDYPGHGIAKGDSYYWWQNYGQPAKYSKEPPRPSQTIGSEKLSRVTAAAESIDDMISTALTPEDIAEAMRNAATEAREVAEEYAEASANLRESFSESATADDCDEKEEQLNSWADELESAADEIDALDLDDYKEEQTEEQANQTAQSGDQEPDELAAAAMLDAAKEIAGGISFPL